ncbi:YwqH-like family protein [Streptococcus acidominimus]|uniref:DUF5082 domain-containing protein n=1 Tax=Streptococcus acidominimus TaxID=1326 RepID=A0A4Y9FST0_STRAI|nr:DUF5082 family protein [Streptococcus acidominimus]MBF0818411.1 DUF5082 family protein [Streptococcus acidominimus]MBF0838600.1 DUF5082 family protein [Streptococcus acidominimus]MBF0846369.1 DUF5082 family protein [Streptococcus danieliae]TFU31318.1 DUF5082 domain-containing protein [Streptococcus acidominimus]
MGKMDDAQIYQLQGQVDTHYANLSAASATIASIDEKLERLRAVKKSIGNIQTDVNDTKVSIMLKKEQPDWKGKQKEEFTSKWEEFSTDYTSFQTEMNTFYDAICDEITRLENQKNEQNGIIGWCQSQINHLGNFIEKLLHTKEG